jgi:hypothetical protein
MHTKFQWRSLLENINLKALERDGRITLGLILQRWVLRMGGRWNKLRIMFNGELWY